MPLLASIDHNALSRGAKCHGERPQTASTARGSSNFN